MSEHEHCSIKQGPCEYWDICAMWDMLQHEEALLLPLHVSPEDIMLDCLPEDLQREVFRRMGWAWE